MSAATVDQKSTIRKPARPKGVAFPRAPRSAAPSGPPSSRGFTILCGTVLTLFALIWLVPLVWAVVTSLRPEGEIAADPTSWWSNNWTLDAYRNVVNSTDIWSWYVNSFVISILTVLFTLLAGSMIGFALARTRFRGRGVVSAVILAGLMVPGQVLILPFFQEFRAVGLLNTYWPIILVAVPAPVAVFVFTAFMRGIPASLIEAARIDGAGWLRVYWRICMPLCRPAVSAVAIFTFVLSWNNFLWPLLALTNVNQMTIPVGLATVQGGFGLRYAEIMASAVLGLLPLLAVFLIFQRRIVQGIASTGIK